MAKEFMQNAYIVNAIAPQAIASSSEQLGSAIDLQNATLGQFSDLTFVLTTDNVATVTTFVIKESSDNSTYTAITSATVTTTSATAGTYMINVSLGGPRLRYMKVSLTASNSTSHVVGCVAIGGFPAFGVNGTTEALRATNAGLVARAVV